MEHKTFLFLYSGVLLHFRTNRGQLLRLFLHIDILLSEISLAFLAYTVLGEV